MEEIWPRDIINKFSRSFLEQQSDDWIIIFYEFLNNQPGLKIWLKQIPLIRLKDGSHVKPTAEVFLPGRYRTNFPTVREAICQSDNARKLLLALNIREPNLIDDVIRNILPKYMKSNYLIDAIDITKYKDDIERITHAYQTDSITNRQNLIRHLQQTAFVIGVDKDGLKYFSKSAILYWRTERLSELLYGIKGVLFVDDNNITYQGKMITKILEVCGAMRNLNPIEVTISEQKRQRLIAKRQTPRARNEQFTDWSIRELQSILKRISSLDIEQCMRISKLLWEELIDLQKEYPSKFTAQYTWTRHRDYYRETDEVAFIEQLNKAAWIPDIHDYLNLKPPSDIVFDDLGWEKDPVLLSMIKFKLPQLDHALQKADIDPKWISVIEEWKKQGKTPGDFLPTKQERDDNKLARKVPGDDSRFVEQLAEAMTIDPVPGPDEPVTISSGGPKTVESAVQDTISSASSGKVGSPKIQSVVSSTPDLEAKERAERFETMLKEDYGKRCQICGSSFLTRKGNLHIFASHIIKPAEHSLTNHFGNRLSLCGWHYTLISYGQWDLLHPDTQQTIDKDNLVDQLQDILCPSTDSINDDTLTRVAIRFSNLYLNWEPKPEQIIETILFSRPHREYLCRLLKTEKLLND